MNAWRPKEVSLREATSVDAPAIVGLVRMHAEATDVVTRVDESYVREFLASLGSGILVAVDPERVIGLLSYSLRPSLIYAGRSCVIEQLVVDPSAQRDGVGMKLVKDLLRRAAEWGCVEVSVMTLHGQRGTTEFYKSHGFGEDSALLHKRLASGEEDDTPSDLNGPQHETG